MENNPANCAALTRRTKGWMGNQAATVLDMLHEDDNEEDETVRTIMGR